MSRSFTILIQFISKSATLFVGSLFFSSLVYATGPTNLSYQAKIYRPDDSVLEAANVNFKFEILNTAETCILYSENFNAVNMTGTGGLVSFVLGSGTQSYVASGTTITGIFDNTVASYTCGPTSGAGSYAPSASHGRKIRMSFQESGFGMQTVPPMAVNSVPYASFAYKASLATSATFATRAASATTAATLNGYTQSDFATSNGLGSGCSGGQVLTFNGSAFVCVAQTGAASAAITSLSFTAPISNTGTASSPVISITQSSLTTNGYLSSTDFTTFSNKLSATSAAITTALGAEALTASSTITLSGDVTGNTTSTVVSFVNGKTASQVSTSVDDTLAATNLATASTIAKRDSSGNIQFNNIGSNITSMNRLNLYNGANAISFLSPVLSASYTLTFPGSGGTVGQVLTTDGTGILSWSSPSAGSVVAVSGTANEVSVTGSASNPIIGLANNGVTSGTYTKVVVDSKGRVSSGTQLVAADIPNLDTNKITSGTFSFARGGTGLNVSGTANQILGMNATASALEYKSVSAGTNISIINNAGELVISSSNGGGTVTNVSATAPLVSTGGATPTISITQATSSTNGFLSFADWNIFNNKLSTLDLGSVSATGTLSISKLPSLAGDVTSVSGSNIITVDRIKNISVSLTAIASNQILQYNGSQFVNKQIPTCGASEYLTFNGTNFVCVTDSGSAGTVASVSGTLNEINVTSGTNAVVSLADNGVVSGTYTKVTVDSKGRVSSATQLIASDIISALTFTPFNPANFGVVPLAGDVTGTLSATVVTQVGGKTSATIATAVDAVTAATSLNVSNTLVRRDGSGNFSASQGTFENSVVIKDGSAGGAIGLYAPTGFTSYNLILPTTSGTVGQVLTANGAGVLSWQNPSTGSVVSVSGTANEVSVTGSVSSPVIGLADNGVTSGTYTKVVVDSKGRVSSGTQLVAADIPNLDTNKISSGTFSFARGGTGLNVSGTANQILGMNSSASALEYKSVSAGTNISITNNAGELVISSSNGGGTITSVSATAPLLVVSSTTTPTLSITQATSSTNGFLSFADWNIFNNKLSTLDLGSASATGTLAIARLPSLAGDVSSVSGSNSITVNYVGGLSSATIATAITQTTSATSLNVSNTIVKRNASGNFNASQGTFENSVVIKDGSVGGAIGLYAPVGFTSYNLTLPTTSGTANQVLTTNGVGVLNWTTPISVSATQWTTSGTDIYYSTGNVGIGTSTSSYVLDVSGTSNFSGNLRYSQLSYYGSGMTIGQSISYSGGSTTGNIIGIQANSLTTGNGINVTSTSNSFSNTLIKSSYTGTGSGKAADFSIMNPSATGTALNVTNLGTGYAAIFNGGNVGIGTSSPVTTLDVSGTVKFAGSTTPVSGGVLTSDATGIATWRLPTSVSGTQWTTSGTSIYYTSGNIGAGTSNPIVPLHAYGANSTNGIFNVESSNGSNTILSVGTTAANTNLINMVPAGGSVGIAGGSTAARFNVGTLTASGVAVAIRGIAGQTGDLLRVDTGLGTSGAAFKITSSGFIGAGTSAPTTTLEVSGTFKVAGTTTPVSGGVLTSDDNGVATWRLPASGNAGTVTSVSATAPLVVVSSTTTPTLSITQAGSSINGFLSFTDWLSFNNKVTSVSATQFFTITGATSSPVLDLANVGSGIVSGTQYTKVTVDSKGRVVSGAQISSSDVTTALGYTPVSAAASSQWTTSGTSVFYNTGNVGIGVSSPVSALDVSGTTRSNGFLAKNGGYSFVDFPQAKIISQDNDEIIFTTGNTERAKLAFGIFNMYVPIHSANGSVTAPNYSFGSDQNTGMYSAATGAIAFTTSGTERVRITTSGVGIGTSSPAATLDVSGTLKFAGSTTPVSGGVLTSDATGIATWRLPASVSGSQWTTSGANIYYDSVGSVGIGSGLSTPTYKLSISGTASINDRTVAINNTPMVYLPDQTNFLGSIAFGNGLRSQSYVSGNDGRFNTAIGIGTLQSNTTGYSNVANGYNALQSNTTGFSNVANGTSALQFNTTGARNVANGVNALYNNTTGSQNVANGTNALFSNKTKSESTAIGYLSMNYADSVSAAPTVSYNTAIGAYSLYGSTTAANNTGIRNTALGHSALLGMTSGSNNIGIGYNAGSAITTLSNNIVIGSNTGSTITTSNTILIADGAGNERFRIDNLGNMGIGTSSPVTTLDVSGTVKFAGSTTPISGGVLTSDATGIATWRLPSSTSSQWTTSGTDIFYNTGNVGIGVSAPTAKLQISGNINVSNTITASSTELILEQTGDFYGTTRLRLRNRNGSNGAVFQNTALDLVDFGFLGNSDNQSNLRYERRSVDLLSPLNTTGEFQFIDDTENGKPGVRYFSSGISATVITSGNFGVGVSTPVATLDVSGTVKFAGATTPVSGGVLTSDASGIATWRLPSSTSSQWTTSGTSIFYNTGFVGIGASSPVSRLEVGTNTTANEVITVKSQNFAGLNLIGDSANTGGEPGGAYVRFSTDGETNVSTLGRVQIAGQDSVGNAYAGTIANSLLLATDRTGTGGIMLGTSDTVRMTVDTSGNVGVGTTSPGTGLTLSGSGHLDVAGSGIFRGIISENSAGRNVRIGVGPFNDSARILFGDASSSNDNWQIDNFETNFRWFTPSGVAMAMSTSGTLSTSLIYNSNSRVAFPGRMSIGSYSASLPPAGGLIISGDVGIGTASPTARLDVSGTVKFAGSTTPVSGGVLTSDASGIATWRLPASGGSSQWTTSGTSIFYNTGNVGIGVSSPTAALEVSGTIRTPAATISAGTTTINTLQSNYYTVSFSANACAALTLNNLQDGQSYVIATSGVTSGACSFTSAGLTFKYAPANAAVTADSVYTLIKVGSIVYVSWITGFQ